MLKNTAIQLATGKLAGASLVPGSLFLLGGIAVWQLWLQQRQLQAQSNELGNELKDIKKQVAGIKNTSKASGKPEVPLSSYFKEKMTGISLPWSKSQ